MNEINSTQIVIDEYETVRAKNIIIATGTTPNRTGAAGEKELKEGEKMITEIENVISRKRETLIRDGVFVFIGMQPNVSLFKDKMATDNWNNIKTDEDMHTSLPDIFAIGDVTSKKYRQITTVVADDTIAAMAIAKELN